MSQLASSPGRARRHGQRRAPSHSRRQRRPQAAVEDGQVSLVLGSDFMCLSLCLLSLQQVKDGLRAARDKVGTQRIYLLLNCKDSPTDCLACTGNVGGRQGDKLPDSKVRGAKMGPIWGRQDPGGPHVGPMNFAIWVATNALVTTNGGSRSFLIITL